MKSSFFCPFSFFAFLSSLSLSLFFPPFLALARERWRKTATAPTLSLSRGETTSKQQEQLEREERHMRVEEERRPASPTTANLRSLFAALSVSSISSTNTSSSPS